MSSAATVFVLLLVFAVPGANGVTATQKIDFKTRDSCEAFRDQVVSSWDGGYDKQRNSNKPTAWGLCIEKPL